MMFVSGKHKGCVTRRSAGIYFRWIRDDSTYSMSHCRLREAIECLKRALIGADPHETSINLKLAKLHHDLEEWAEASAYHRRVVEVCRANGGLWYDYIHGKHV